MTITIQEYKRRVEASSAAVRAQIDRTMLIFAINAEAAGKLNMTVDFTQRTGRLRNSVAGEYDPKSTTVTLSSGRGGANPVRYARAQEFGATILGRPYLRIPLRPALTGRGGLVDRFAGESLRTTGIAWFAFRSRSGELFLGRRGDVLPSGAPRAWYKLVRQTTIRGKHTITRTMAAQVRTLPRELAGAVRVGILSGDS